MSEQKRGPQKIGNVLAIPLGDGTYGYARVLKSPLTGFYDIRTPEVAPLGDVLRAQVAFKVCVMDSAFRGGIWKVIGNAPLEAELLEEPLFFKEDPISGALSIYRDSTGEEMPATRQECEELERAAVWSQNHIVDRLNDHFHGRPCKWGGKGK